MSTVITGIAELTTNDGPRLRDASIVVEDGEITWVGTGAPAADRRIDVQGRAVIPGFVDTHTHLVFDGDRAGEHAARMAGTAYDGGGIATTVAATRAATDERLEALVSQRIRQMRASGTTTVEIKSGYGLATVDERRLLGVARRHTPETTFLGAHVVPAGKDRSAYLDSVTGPMLAACAPLARWIDVFCEPASAHAFDGDEARAVLTAGARHGLGLRVHGNQLSAGPGVRLAVELGAASVDHCTFLTDADVDALSGGDTVATLLPAVEFSTRQPYPDARRLLDAGVRVALATDCNPGTAYTSSMPFVIALAVRELRLTTEEAIRAATATAAEALRRKDIGVIRVGAKADLAVVDGPSADHIAYRPGMATVTTLEVG